MFAVYLERAAQTVGCPAAALIEIPLQLESRLQVR
jgi:hypothetical protein